MCLLSLLVEGMTADSLKTAIEVTVATSLAEIQEAEMEVLFLLLVDRSDSVSRRIGVSRSSSDRNTKPPSLPIENLFHRLSPVS